MMKLLNVCAGYDDRDTLHDISLHFAPGRIYTVVGKNGCGKSTLLKSCAALLPLSRGSIQINNRELSLLEPRERAQMLSYLPQVHAAPGISVQRMVEHGCYPRLSRPRKLTDTDHDAVQRAMERMDILPLCRKSVKELSGGECQRVYMAMQLAQDSGLLLLDEPTTYMDIEYQLKLMSLLQELRAEGKCIVMVLHDLHQALKYSDDIIAMETGRIAGTASPEEAIASGLLERIFNVRIEDENGHIRIGTKNHPN